MAKVVVAGDGEGGGRRRWRMWWLEVMWVVVMVARVWLGLVDEDEGILVYGH